MLTLLLGGARSGKSALALDLAGSTEVSVVFLATAEPLDPDLAERIARHRAERPASWETVEEPVELERQLAKVPDKAVVVIDCLTLWVSNLFEASFDDGAILERAASLAAFAHERPGRVIVVSNEVGSGIVPADALTRRYRDALGRVNATFAAVADEALLVVAGRTLALQAVGALLDDGPRGSAR